MPLMRLVPLRSSEQIGIQSIHRARQRLLEQRDGMTSQMACSAALIDEP